ncbi:MAG TPA: ribosome biogenesis GTP-binding protein YihA/YsxC [Polyangia bacterium]|nr:ribosome biogenesis GTP-binding protein YihA/YsxC [Polyangia bacterium]
MRVVEAEFLRSATDPAIGTGWPDEGPPEIAFCGRSNVGKSTLLGALTGRRGLVRVSSTPGRTRLINFFRLIVGEEKRELRFVDLPGFGYAKVAKSERAGWRAFVERYLGHRRSLKVCVLLVDARRGAELDETELARWLAELGVHVLPVVTKADKLAKHERRPAAERVKKQLGVQPVMVSATDGTGVDEVWRRVAVALGWPSV